jgi:hypothetical protein
VTEKPAQSTPWVSEPEVLVNALKKTSERERDAKRKRTLVFGLPI